MVFDLRFVENKLWSFQGLGWGGIMIFVLRFVESKFMVFLLRFVVNKSWSLF